MVLIKHLTEVQFCDEKDPRGRINTVMPVEDFYENFSITDNDNIETFNYEPLVGIYSVGPIYGQGVSYEDPTEHPLLSQIHEKFNEIKTFMAQLAENSLRPSEYHQWSGTEWVISAEDEVTLGKETALADAEIAIQSHLDSTARARGYDNIMSACSYAAVPNTYQGDGTKAIMWRSNVWDVAYTILTDVEAGTRTQPTTEELIAELPVIDW